VTVCPGAFNPASKTVDFTCADGLHSKVHRQLIGSAPTSEAAHEKRKAFTDNFLAHV
jgi:hypothetical protein